MMKVVGSILDQKKHLYLSPRLGFPNLLKMDTPKIKRLRDSNAAGAYLQIK